MTRSLPLLGGQSHSEVSTHLHRLLQYLFMRLLGDAGWIPASEVRLKVASGYEPVPDIIASRAKLPQPYPTTTPELCIEILSKDEPDRPSAR